MGKSFFVHSQQENCVFRGADKQRLLSINNDKFQLLGWSGLLIFSGLLFVLTQVTAFARQLSWVDISGGNSKVNCVFFDASASGRILIGTDGGVLETLDSGKSWRSSLIVKGANRAVNLLHQDPRDKNCIYACTGAGLFRSQNKGKSWSRIFRGKDYHESECTAIATSKQKILLGTRSGLFLSMDSGRTWSKAQGALSKSSILSVAYNLKIPDNLYVACPEGVFATKDGGAGWERIFVASPEEEDRVSEEEAVKENAQEVSFIRYLCMGPDNPNILYLATSRGIYMSPDSGKEWRPVSSFGLLTGSVNFVLVGEDSAVYALTGTGIFEFNNNRWSELSFELSATGLRYLAQDKGKHLFVACKQGLFRSEQPFVSNQKNFVEDYFENEPRIKEVQEAAIRYAEVEPEKIIRWRQKAAKRAYLPKLTTGIGNNITDMWHWETGSSTKSGDDILLQGKPAFEWDVSLSWDLSEIIWSEAQTSIDVRSRLMVQLREDILDEVNKTYFERIRLKNELFNLPIEDRKKRFEKELRLKELTASLDGLTGGYFSNQLGNRS